MKIVLASSSPRRKELLQTAGINFEIDVEGVDEVPQGDMKFYSNKILTNKDFETNIKGLRAIGDGASVTRGLQQASANGLSVAKSILNK